MATYTIATGNNQNLVWSQIARAYTSMAESLNSILDDIKDIYGYGSKAEVGFSSYYKSDSELRKKMYSNLKDINDDTGTVITDIYKIANEATHRAEQYSEAASEILERVQAVYDIYNTAEEQKAATFSFEYNFT